MGYTMRKRLVQLLTLVTICLSTMNLWAQELYQVEIIIFQQQANVSQEQFISNPPLPAVAGAIELQPYQGHQQAYHLLPETAFKLTAEADKLIDDPNYQLLLHQAWAQPIDNPNTTRPVHIQAGSLEQYEILPFYQWKINGTLQLSQLSYFQLKVDLMLNLPIKEAQRMNLRVPYHALGQNVLSIPFNYQRRLSADQLYYIDHPIYALLIQIIDLNDDDQ
jgi:Peptidoglycan-binding protein, CsiV